jgi:hypothetical protein
VHLVEEKQGAGLGALRHLPELGEQLGQVLLGVAGVGHARVGLDVELDPDAGGNGDAERLHHAEGSLHPIPHSLCPAHLPEETAGHAGKGKPEVGLGTDLHHVGGGPARLAGHHVELHQQDGLPHAAQAAVDEAAFVAA